MKKASLKEMCAVGNVFGRWTVTSMFDSYKVICKCNCGTESRVFMGSLASGKTKGCRACQKIPGPVTHGMSGSSEHRTWKSMRARCLNPSHKDYKHYGGRGISICDRWNDFANFFADMGPRPQGTTLDRWPDQNGNYEASNCRWATPIQQANNTRGNKLIDYKGKKYTVAELARHLRVGDACLRARIKQGRRLEGPCQRRYKVDEKISDAEG